MESTKSVLMSNVKKTEFCKKNGFVEKKRSKKLFWCTIRFTVSPFFPSSACHENKYNLLFFSSVSNAEWNYYSCSVIKVQFNTHVGCFLFAKSLFIFVIRYNYLFIWCGARNSDEWIAGDNYLLNIKTRFAIKMMWEALQINDRY